MLEAPASQESETLAPPAQKTATSAEEEALDFAHGNYWVITCPPLLENVGPKTGAARVQTI